MASVTSDVTSPPSVKKSRTQAPLAPSPPMKKRKGRRGKPSTNLDETQVEDSPMRRSVRLASRSRSRGRNCNSQSGDQGTAHAVTVKAEPGVIDLTDGGSSDSCLEGEDSGTVPEFMRPPTPTNTSSDHGEKVASSENHRSLFQPIWTMSKHLKGLCPRAHSKSPAVVADKNETLPNDEKTPVGSDVSQEARKEDNRVEFSRTIGCMALFLTFMNLVLHHYFQNWPYELSGTVETSSRTEAVNCRCQCDTPGPPVEIFNFKGMMTSALRDLFMGNN